MRPSPLLVLVLGGMAVQTALGLILNPYRDVDWIALGWLGNDAVTLLLVCPLLAAALSGPRRLAPRWHLIRLGSLGYAVYNYAFYMLGATLNAMFPLYVALFVVALIALLSALSETRVARLAQSFSAKTPVRVLGGYLVAVAIGLSAVWLGIWALHVFANRPAPGSPEVFRLVAALDLGFMVPALSIGGVLLWCRKPLGYVLASVAAMQAALYLLVLSVNSALAIHRGLARWPGELPIWAPLGLATIACTLVLIRHVSSNPTASDGA
ncbi:MAG TPA: hypothetical protein PLH94_03115 [Fimbriimonadaceae bacterium]|nr:hypothetical protein [Fimbriimonadaceae bacterium]